MEIEGDKINFLDLTITLNQHQNVIKQSFGVYRKPTYSGVSIHANSLHPPHQKVAAINSAIHRLVRLPLSREVYENEIAEIEKIAHINAVSYTHLTLPTIYSV